MLFNNKKTNKKLQASRKQPVNSRSINMKPFLVVMSVMLSVLVVTFLITKKSEKIWFPITQVSVNGVVEHEDKTAIQTMVLEDLKAGFFNVDLDRIVTLVKDRNWVAESTVRRVWPNSIDIVIREHQAVAVWNNKQLLSSNGEIFNANNVQSFKSFPHLTGKNEQAKQVLLAYSQIEQQLSNHNMTVVTLDNKKIDELKVQFNTGLRALFSFNDKDRQIQRFKGLVAQDFINQQHIKVIDMRYNNGFSVVINEPIHTSVINVKQYKHLIMGKHHV